MAWSRYGYQNQNAGDLLVARVYRYVTVGCIVLAALTSTSWKQKANSVQQLLQEHAAQAAAAEETLAIIMEEHQKDGKENTTSTSFDPGPPPPPPSSDEGPSGSNLPPPPPPDGDVPPPPPPPDGDVPPPPQHHAKSTRGHRHPYSYSKGYQYEHAERFSMEPSRMLDHRKELRMIMGGWLAAGIVVVASCYRHLGPCLLRLAILLASLCGLWDGLFVLLAHVVTHEGPTAIDEATIAANVTATTPSMVDAAALDEMIINEQIVLRDTLLHLKNMAFFASLLWFASVYLVHYKLKPIPPMVSHDDTQYGNNPSSSGSSLNGGVSYYSANSSAGSVFGQYTSVGEATPTTTGRSPISPSISNPFYGSTASTAAATATRMAQVASVQLREMVPLTSTGTSSSGSSRTSSLRGGGSEPQPTIVQIPTTLTV